MPDDTSQQPDHRSQSESHAPTHYERVKAIFVEVLDQPIKDRSSFLASRCGADDALRAAVDALLSEHEDSADFLRTPVEIPSEIEAAILPDSIGDYRVIGRLGEGATGVVYRAQQANPEREVAIKILRPGLLTPRMLRRFRDEAQVLGRLKHPGIAQILEAGSMNSDYGRQPYLVMELVEGDPISTYVDTRNASTDEVLELMARVCEAVHHAHLNGVIHRDLKPANILVDAHGQPCILDFGIARVLDEEHDRAHTITREGQVLGTVPYMSPEQVSGSRENVDVRSDVYALGVILYRLLAGHLPHRLDRLDLLEAARLIRETEPTMLGTIDRDLRGDVETIVATALAKEPERRYQSALAMAEDLRRYQNDRPINARPATAMYQITKFAKRNRALVALAVVALILLIGAVMGTGIGMFKAKVANAEAQRHAQRAEAVRAFVLEMLAPEIGNRDLTVYEALQWAAGEVDARFKNDPVIRGDVHAEIAVAYVRLGEIDLAQTHARLSLEARRKEFGEDHHDTVKAKNNLAMIMMKNSGATTVAEYAEIDQLLIEARNAVEDSELRRVIIANQANAAFQRGNLDVAESLMSEILVLMGAENRDDSETDSVRLNLAIVARQRGNHDRAREEIRTVVANRTRNFGPDHELTNVARLHLGKTEAFAGRHDEAEAIFAPLYPAMCEQLTSTHRDVILLQNERAMNLKRAERLDEAASLWESAITTCVETRGEDDYLTQIMVDSLAITYARQDRIDEAGRLHRRGITSFVRTYGDGDERTQRKRVSLVAFLIFSGECESAIAESRDLVDALRQLTDPPAFRIAGGDVLLGAALLCNNEVDAADAILSTSRDALETSRPALYLGDICNWIGDRYEALGRADDAAAWHALGPSDT